MQPLPLHAVVLNEPPPLTIAQVPVDALLMVEVKVTGVLLQVALLPEMLAAGGAEHAQETENVNVDEVQVVFNTLAVTVCEPFTTAKKTFEF